MRKFLAILSVVSIIPTLFACGGGGGDSSSTPPVLVIPAPTGRVSTISPAIGEMNVTIDVQPVITLSVTDAKSSDTKGLTLMCSGRTVPFTSTSVLSTDGKIMTIPFTIAAGLTLAGDVCTSTGGITTTGPDGKTVVTPIGMSFSLVPIPKCDPPTSWSATGNTCISPVAMLVSGANQLQVCGVDLYDCLRKGMFNGTVKVVSSTYTFNNRVVSFAYFINPRGKFVVLPLYADDLSLVGNAIDIMGGTDQILDNVIGAYNGAIAHNPDTGLCVVVTVNPLDNSPLFNSSPCVVFPK